MVAQGVEVMVFTEELCDVGRQLRDREDALIRALGRIEKIEILGEVSEAKRAQAFGQAGVDKCLLAVVKLHARMLPQETSSPLEVLLGHQESATRQLAHLLYAAISL